MAFIPLTLIWFGTSTTQKLVILFIAIFFQEVLLVMDNVKNVPCPVRGHGLHPRPVTGQSRLRRVIFRAALPGIVDTLRISMGWGWTYLVVVELVGATNGLGFQIQQAERYLDTPEIILGIIIIGMLGLIFDFSFKAIYARGLPLHVPGGALAMAATLVLKGVEKTFRSRKGDGAGPSRHQPDPRRWGVRVRRGSLGVWQVHSPAHRRRPRTASAGELTLDGAPLLAAGKDRGMVFQQYTLYPWLSAQDNVEFGLRHLPKKQRAEEARRFLDVVGLVDFAGSYPFQLSGGMQQRVAIARALALRPSILLMDEPFGALDAQTRSLMQELLLSIWERDRLSVLFVTHDIDEAIFLADRICVLSTKPGQVREIIEVHLPRPRDFSQQMEQRVPRPETARPRAHPRRGGPQHGLRPHPAMTSPDRRDQGPPDLARQRGRDPRAPVANRVGHCGLFRSWSC